jgi:hypothetical protein
MPDKSTMKTLCVIPVDQIVKPGPTSWDTIKKGEFYLINGQHSVTANKMMVDMNLDDEIVKHFRN